MLDFHRALSKVFDRVKSVALWSEISEKLPKNHKGYGSAATFLHALMKFKDIDKIKVKISETL